MPVLPAATRNADAPQTRHRERLSQDEASKSAKDKKRTTHMLDPKALAKSYLDLPTRQTRASKMGRNRSTTNSLSRGKEADPAVNRLLYAELAKKKRELSQGIFFGSSSQTNNFMGQAARP
jgi:hypothetical protein